MSLHRYLSRAIAGLMDSKISWLKNLLISCFVFYYKPNMHEALQENIHNYASFNEFFARRLKPNARRLADSSLISPADGRLKDAGRISQSVISSIRQSGTDKLDSSIPINLPSNIPSNIKGTRYSVATLLGLPQDSPLVSKFSTGQYANIYLAPKDYHRVHFPCDLRITLTQFIPGALFPVNDKSVTKRPSLYAHNQRLACIGDTKHGLMAVVMVAALFVSSIGTSWGAKHRSLGKKLTDKQERHFNKGDELGYFYMGSSVVLLLENSELQLMPESENNIRLGNALYKVRTL